jgi:hypothetical protein
MTELLVLDSVIDLDMTLKPTLEQLCKYFNTCFQDGTRKTSVRGYYKRLISFIHSDLKFIRGSGSGSGSSDVVFDALGFGLTYKTLEIDDDNDFWKICVMYTDKSKTTVAASSLVNFDYMTGIARTKEVCVGIHNNGYCKKLLNMIINHIIKNEPKINKITTYCEHANTFACKCYRSVYSSLNPTITYDPNKGTTTYMYMRPQLESRYGTRTKRGGPTAASSSPSPSTVKRLRGQIGSGMTTPDNKYTLQKISRVNGDDVY